MKVFTMLAAAVGCSPTFTNCEGVVGLFSIINCQRDIFTRDLMPTQGIILYGVTHNIFFYNSKHVIFIEF